MKKMSRGAYEDTKGFLRMAETLFEILLLSVVYYIIWRKMYNLPFFGFKGKYVLMGVYAFLTYILFQNSDCTMFGQLRRTDLVLGQVIALLMVNFITYFQCCLIATYMLSPLPMLVIFLVQCVIALVLIVAYTAL